MMKLILSLTLIWMLSNTAEALQCLDNEIDIDTVLRHCDSADELCATTAMQAFPENASEVDTYFIRSCVPSSLCTVHDQILSFNAGLEKLIASVHCCNTDGCNSQNVSYPGIQANNGLQCVSCADPESTVCNETIQCQGVEDRCFNGTVEDEDDTYQILGCASSNVCEVFSQLKVQKAFAENLNFTSAPKCCGTSFCNSAWTVKLSVVPLLLGLIALIVY